VGAINVAIEDDEKMATKKNPTKLKAEHGKQELFITREFDAPQELVFQSVADRNGMMQSGMERGIHDSYERLDEILAKMKNMM
jgi:hypothetical protein